MPLIDVRFSETQEHISLFEHECSGIIKNKLLDRPSAGLGESSTEVTKDEVIF